MKTNAMRLPGIDDGMPEPPKPKRAALYVCHQQNDVPINIRRSDGYVDATAMCRAYGKLFANYRQDHPDLFVTAESVIGMPISLLVQSQRGGRYAERGTWVHPLLAIQLAQWCSPPFALIVSAWVFDVLQGRKPDVAAAAQLEPFVMRKLLGVVERLDQPSEPPALDLDALAEKLADKLVRRGFATRDDLYGIEDTVRHGLEELKLVKADGIRSQSILVGMQEDLWGYFKLDPAAIQKLQKEHDRQRKERDRTGPTASGLPWLAEARKELVCIKCGQTFLCEASRNPLPTRCAECATEE